MGAANDDSVAYRFMGPMYTVCLLLFKSTMILCWCNANIKLKSIYCQNVCEMVKMW